ncbi:MAG: hypothetical protein IT340_18520 [Chloroflexi bacterium]|nr:hypothetical protein [Chloroflexota bacterium]
MHVTILQPALTHALALVAPAAGGVSPVPNLDHVHLRAGDGTLTLTTTDLTVAVSAPAAATIWAPGALTVPAQLLAKLAASLPGVPVELAVDAGGALAVRAGRTRATLAAGPADDFPLPPTPGPGSPTLAWLGAELRPMLGQVLVAARDRDDVRPALAAVRWEFDPPALAATDGVRLAVRRGAGPAAPGLPGVLVPRRALAELARLLRSVLGRVTLTVDAERGALTAETPDGLRWAARLVEGGFPDYRGLLPDATPCRAVVERVALRSALRRSARFDPDGHVITLAVAPGEGGPGLITIAARGRETGESVSELEAAIAGGPMTLALDAVLLDELLAAAGGLEVELGFQSPALPCLIRPVTGADLRYLLMPCLPTAPAGAPAPPAAPDEAGDRELLADKEARDAPEPVVAAQPEASARDAPGDAPPRRASTAGRRGVHLTRVE